MPILKTVVGITTLIISGFVQFYAASISLPVMFASFESPGIFLMAISIFASANLLVAGAIALIYSRYDHDSRLAAVLYIIGSVPLLLGGSNVVAVGVLAFIFAILLFINYFAITRQQ